MSEKKTEMELEAERYADLIEGRYKDGTPVARTEMNCFLDGALYLLEVAEKFAETNYYRKAKHEEIFGKDTRTSEQKCHDAGMYNLIDFMRRYCKGSE